MDSPLIHPLLLILLVGLLVAWFRVWPEPLSQSARPKAPHSPRPRTPTPPQRAQAPLDCGRRLSERRRSLCRLSRSPGACPRQPWPPRAACTRNRTPAVRRATTFSVRWHLILSRLKTASHWVAEVLTAQADRLDLGATVRVFGHSEGTLCTWLTRAGLRANDLHCRTPRICRCFTFRSTNSGPLCVPMRR
jgi:hypothetical protein